MIEGKAPLNRRLEEFQRFNKEEAFEELMENTGSDMSWDEMDELNYWISFKNITSGKMKANTEKKKIGCASAKTKKN